MPRQWTEEQKRRQAEIIRKHKPWEKSSGPKTARGKAVSSRNATKEGTRTMKWNMLRKGFAYQRRFLRLTEMFFVMDALRNADGTDDPLTIQTIYDLYMKQ